MPESQNQQLDAALGSICRPLKNLDHSFRVKDNGNMSHISPLSADTIAQIHSSRNITCLQGVILALLENSLDAGSNKVEITADFRKGGCIVEDNGSGIPWSDFLDSGGLLKMYHTSKHGDSRNSTLHGATGTYLASLSALSLLSVASRHCDSLQSASLTSHQSKIISRQAPASEIAHVSLSNHHGTCVTVRDLFGNMPVRVKQRASALDKSGPDAKAWSDLKLGIVALLLAWPKPCSVRLRDAETDAKVLHLSSLRSNINGGLTKRGLDQLAGKDIKFDLQDVLPILFQAGLAPVETRAEWIPVSATTLKVSVRGALCLHPSPTKQCQFISVGVQPCSTVPGGSSLYEVVNKLFNSSSFGAFEDEERIDDAEKDRRRHDRRFKSDGYTQKQTHGRKGVDRWPMFLLRVEFVDRKAPVEPERMNESSLKVIVDVLEATIIQWLTSNHFRPRKLRGRKEKEGVLSPGASPLHARPGSRDIRTPVHQRNGTLKAATTSKKRKYIDITGTARKLQQHVAESPTPQNGYFTSWSRIKSGRSSFFVDDFHGKKPATAPNARSGSIADTGPLRDRLRFDLPAVDAGELNTGKLVHYQGDPLQQHNAIPSSTALNPPVDTHTSSDDYGSFDGQEILTAVEGQEHTVNDRPHSNKTMVTDATAPLEDHIDDDTTMEWTDPKTRQVYKINARTGVVLPSRPKSLAKSSHAEGEAESPVRQRAGIDTSLSSKGQSLSLARRPVSKHNKDRWLPGFLKEWSNPVFVQQSEEQIPVTAASLDGFEMSEADCGAHTHKIVSHQSKGANADQGIHLSKASLGDVRVIKQVDQKYILCKTVNNSGASCNGALILVDQHAASERVILEDLLAELCAPIEAGTKESRSKVSTVALEKPLRFEISDAEHRLLNNHAQRFADWGVLYQLVNKEEALGASQVREAIREYTIVVESLPPGIVERCALVPRLLIDLLRTEIWTTEGSTKKRSSNAVTAADNETAEEEHSWLRRIGSCPRGIIDMLNSRACRSAVMFNDELSVAQCQELLRDLSKCAFPFMCAHGRVSMVPLVEAGAIFEEEYESTPTISSNSSSTSFTSAFRAWKAGSAGDRDSTTSDS